MATTIVDVTDPKATTEEKKKATPITYVRTVTPVQAGKPTDETYQAAPLVEKREGQPTLYRFTYYPSEARVSKLKEIYPSKDTMTPSQRDQINKIEKARGIEYATPEWDMYQYQQKLAAEKKEREKVRGKGWGDTEVSRTVRPSEVRTVKGEVVTGTLSREGWVSTKESGRVYDPLAYAAAKGYMTSEQLEAKEEFDKSFKDLPEELQRAYYVKGIEGYNEKRDEYNKIVKTLEPYKVGTNQYDITAAIRAGVATDKIKQVFGKDALEKAKSVGIEPTLTVKTVTDPNPVVNKAVKWWHKITPWDEQAGETFSSALAKRINAVRDRYGLSPQQIEEARIAYLQEDDGTILEKMPEGKSFEWDNVWNTPKKSELEAKLSPERKEMVDALDNRVNELLEMPPHQAYLEEAKVATELALAGIGHASAVILPELRRRLKEKGKDLPPTLRMLVEAIGGLAIGSLIAAPLATAYLANEVAKTAYVPDKGNHLKEIGSGVVTFFRSIPATVAAEPALASGELVGMFVLGPEGAAKVAKGVGARAAPAYIPKRGMGIEYSVARVPSRLANKTEIVKAVNTGIKRAMESETGSATVKIGDGSLRLKIRSTPMSEVVGPALYHATPVLVESLKKGIVKGELYASPQLAIRFAESSASGTPQANPAIIMIYTKRGNVKWSPTTNLYKGAKEIEAVYGTTKLQRVKSLWDRLTFGKAGDFITVHNGEIIPIFRFKEPGAVAPPISLADLVSIRLKTIKESLADLVKGRRGYEVTRETHNTIKRRVVREVEKEVRKGKSVEDAYDIVYRREIRRSIGRNRTLLERAYRTNPEKFERSYLRELQREYQNIARERVDYRNIDNPIVREEYRALEETGGRLGRYYSEPVEVRQIKEGLYEVVRRQAVGGRGKARIPSVIRGKRVTTTTKVLIPSKTIPIRDTDIEMKEGVVRPSGQITWRQGFGWWVINYPYKSRKDIDFTKEEPVGATVVSGPGSAYKTIQTLTGKAPTRLILDMGIMDVTITGPKKAGAGGTIKFKRDVKRKTKGDIPLKLRTVSA